MKVNEMIHCFGHGVSSKESVDPTVNRLSDRKSTSKCNPTCRIATVDDRSAAYIFSSLDNSLKYLIKGYVRLF